MPTEQDFNATIQPWIEQGIPQAAFRTPRQTFSPIKKTTRNCCTRMSSLFSFSAELQAFLTRGFPPFQIPLRFQHNPVEANFFGSSICIWVLCRNNGVCVCVQVHLMSVMVASRSLGIFWTCLLWSICLSLGINRL